MLPLLLATAALATEPVVVLDLDAYGLGWTHALAASNGLRQAFSNEGTLAVVSSRELANKMSWGHEVDLADARDALADGRLKVEAGDYEGALGPLGDALNLHDAAGSAVCRRPEMADAYGWTGVALVMTGSEALGIPHMVEALYLFPGWDDERTTSLPWDARAAFDQAWARFADEPRRQLPGPAAASIAERVGVRYVVTGWVDATGSVRVRLNDGASVVSEAKGTLSDLPPATSDPVFSRLVSELVAPLRPVTRVIPMAPMDLSGLDEDLPHGPDYLDGDPLEDGFDGDPSEGLGPVGPFPPPASVPAEVTPPPRRTWWIWTTATAVVGGGTAAAVLATREPPTQVVVEPDTYTVQIIIGD